MQPTLNTVYITFVVLTVFPRVEDESKLHLIKSIRKLYYSLCLFKTGHSFVTYCSPKPHKFGEHGTYTYKIHSVGRNTNCVFITDKKPDNPFLRE